MRIQPLLFSFGLVSLLTCCAAGADPSATVFTDAASAGPDFALQGEYKGTLPTQNGDKTIGAQVVALGDGNFQIVGYHDGLPGDGWGRDGERNMVEAKLVDGKITAQIEKATIEIADGRITVSVNGEKLGTLSKVHRESPTLGKQPPAGATVLFDGTSSDHFENGKLIEEQWLGATNCVSKQKLGDHQLHIEFRTPFMPTARGQGRGNSGVYVQGRYEVQVLDSFGLEGKNNECGGIYSISEPIVNMCFPPLSWQTYDIDFTAARYDDAGNKTKNARATIKHNGVVIHDDLELTHGTPGYHGEGPEADSLFLQDHGNPVVFRNIWIIEK